MAVAMASPKIVYKSEAIERIAASASLGFGEAQLGESLGDKESSSVRAMADAKLVAVAESTATLERQVSISCSEIGNLNVWRRGVLLGGDAVAASVRTGRRMVPKTPFWSRKDVGRVTVPPLWEARCRTAVGLK